VIVVKCQISNYYFLLIIYLPTGSLQLEAY